MGLLHMCTLMWEGSLDLKTATPDADCVEESPEWTVSSSPLVRDTADMTAW